MMKSVFAGVALAATTTWAGAAGAAIVLNSGQFGGPGFHSTPGESLPTVTGFEGLDEATLSTDVPDIIDTSGNGESKYAADDGTLDDLSIALSIPVNKLTFNLNVPNGPHVSTDFVLSVNGGAFNFTRTGLGNGQNKYTLTAS